jgi:serine/threonine protein kinase
MSTDDPLLNKQLGDYTIIDLLGQGGMARVYRGYDAKLDRYSAIKVIDSTLAASQDADEYRERFSREARAIARLRHPNIVNIYQFGEFNGTYYMAMAFLEGRDLRHILQEYAERGERMPAAEVLSIARDIASALDYAHQNDVIHRDVKPSNIMVTTTGAVLMDFGLALHVPEGTTGNIFGTAHYIAPEQAVSSAQAVPQSDLYSLGIVLYEMLVGHVPFDDPSAMSVALKHISEPPPPPRRFNPDLSTQAEAVLMRALEKEPQDRFPNSITMIRALEGGLNIKDEDQTLKDPPARPIVPPVAPDVSEPVAQRLSNTMWIIIAAGVAILLVAGLLLLNAGGQQADVGATQTAVALAAITEEPTIAPSDTSAPPDTNTPPPTTDAVPTATIPATPALEAVRDLTARSGPGSQYPSVATLPGGERVDIVGISEDGAWFQVALPDGALGWVSASPALVQTAGVNLRDVPIVAAPTNTPTDIPTATSIPTERPTLTPTPGIAPTIVSETADVILYYDPDTLVLLNRSEHEVDVSRLTFVQTTADGRELAFSTERWDEGSRPTNALPARDCFQVWTLDLSALPKPDYCNRRHAQAQVGSQSWFWISEDPDATFQVVRRRSGRADEVLATCVIAAEECELPLGRGTVVASPATATPRPTDAATAEPTIEPTARATEILSTTSEGPVLLTWDADSLMLLNRATAPVDISGLTFVQVTSVGRQLSFESNRWDGGSRSIYALPSGDCFQVWRDSITSVLPIPDDCDARGSWQSAGSTRWFWMSDDDDETFEVRRGSDVLAVCPISAGECAFDPGDESAAVPSVADAPVSTDTQISAGSATGLVLIYDADSLVLFNGTSEDVDVSRMTFVQIEADGGELLFPSDRWDGSESLSPGDCFHVWRDSLSNVPEPDYCDSRLAWQMVASTRWFWISANMNATFEVRRDDAILAACRIGDGQCILNLDGVGVSL